MTELLSFSAALRERSSGSHSRSEHSGFMADLLRGEATREDYVSLVAQHYFIYEALEHAAELMRNDPVASVFITDKLTRLPALETDLEFLIGDDWRERITALPTTERYVERIRQVGSTWAGGFVAHHYTRYLGDLSGGIFIGRVMARQFGFETNGVGFYLFDAIADPNEFKNVYRDQLDAAPWDEKERDRIIDEVLLAYRFNTELFEALDSVRQVA
ncbi:heme oxygenase (biliverdin-producing) [Microbacterium sp. YY-01]|uniref:biliverdin-producing heme oxygenase n=1 Tax=Microbacterium sp. YY-01 TaxID=3421634 RepID=UPI003D1851AD